MSNSSLLSSSRWLRMRRLAPLALVALLGLFPYGWLGEVFAPFGALAGLLFPTEAMHGVGHVLIFFSMGAALLGLFPALRRHRWFYGIIMLLLGCTQEFFQLSYSRITWNDVQDLGFDMLGAALAFVVVRWWKTRDV
ncbi:MAG: hypothetical protein MUD01_17110 [Chloroflexaceae bacterium]|jgi:glycopeptide antibiotics resistance protein|nr:hypothetical protein [Chloroflexaceae bacterium]